MSPRIQKAVAAGAFLALLTAWTLWLRWPVTQTEMLQNEDIAGITYNADLLLHGQVPMVDNLEYKAPGSFFATALTFKLFGRSVKSMEYVGVLLALLAAIAVFVAGWTISGFWSGVVAAIIYATIAPISDSMTVNYGSWMIAPYAWATALFALAIKRGHWGWFLATGMLVTVAGLMKRQGIMLAPAFFFVIVALPFFKWQAKGGNRSFPRALAAYAAGGIAAMIPICIYYAYHGALGVFLQHFLASQSGWEYVQGGEGGAANWPRLKDGFLGIFEYSALPFVLACLAVFSWRPTGNRQWTPFGLMLGLNLLFSFIGACLGLRFYKSYYLQWLPALALIAAFPHGPILRWFQRPWPQGVFQVVGRCVFALATVALCFPAGASTLSQTFKQRDQRATPTRVRREARDISDYIQDRTQPTDKIWVWGRWAWPVYFYADRLAPMRYYKVLGVITNNLTNTWRRTTVQTRFVKRGPWREIGDQLTERKPAFIVIARNERYNGFTALEQLLKNEYTKVRKVPLSAFDLYELRSRTNEPPPRSHTRRPTWTPRRPSNVFYAGIFSVPSTGPTLAFQWHDVRRWVSVLPRARR